MGALYRELPTAFAMAAGPDKEAAVAVQAKALRTAYGPFTRACDVMIVDGGNSVATAVQEVFRTSRAIYMCLLGSPGQDAAGVTYEREIRSYWNAVNSMVWAMHREATQGSR